MNKKITALLQIMGILLLLLTGCERIGALQESKNTGTAGDKEGFLVYCTNAECTKLISISVNPEAESFDGIVSELLKNFEDPKGEENYSLLQDGVRINEYSTGVDTLTVDFNAAYLGLSNVKEILLRAGIVKTLVRVPGIIFVQITVDGQPITEYNGEKIGPMNEETFVDSRGNSINSYRQTELKLYFPDQEGNLIAEEREVHYSSNVPVERMIVDQTIRGPEREDALAVASPQVEINSVKTSDGVCVIDLDIGFNQDLGNGVTPELCLYSFINAIIEQTDVEKVRFLIDGVENIRFRGQISLEQAFSRDVRLFDRSVMTSQEEEESKKNAESAAETEDSVPPL